MIRLDTEATVRALLKLADSIPAGVHQALGQSAAYALQHARATERFNDQTGRLRASLRRGQRSPFAFFVQAGSRSVQYAKFVEDDTKPHEIRARRAKALRFFWNGELTFRCSVQHPGTTGKKFMLAARNESEDRLLRFVSGGLSALIH